MDTRELTFILKARDQASEAVRGLKGGFHDLGAAASQVGKVVAIAAAAGIAALGGIAATSMKAAADAQVISAQTAAVLESTKAVSGMTQKSVEDLATSLSLVTPFEDDLIQKTENMLLTFTNIGQDVFPQVTETALNMAQALGGDPVQQSIALGKALNDPINGISALRRVGVTFTESQMTLIKSLQDTGDVAGAQKVILGELNTEFGNSARAAGETFAGKLAIAQHALGNVQEAIGGPLITAFSGLMTSVTPMIVAFGEKIPFAFDILGEIFGVLTGSAPAAGAALTGALGPETASTIMTAFATIREAVKVALDFITTTVIPAAQAAMKWLGENWDAVAFAMKVVAVTVVIPMFVAWAAAAGIAAAATIAALLPILVPVAAVGAAAFFLYQVWTQNMGGVQEKTQALVSFLKAAFDTVVGALTALWTAAQTIWQQFTDNPPRMIGEMIGIVIGFFMTLPTRIGTLLLDALGAVGKFVLDSAAAFVKWVTDNQTTITDFVKALPAQLFQAGVNMVQGLINGLGSMKTAVWNAVSSFFGGIVDGVKSALGIKSPSTVFAGIGANVALGLVQGLQAGQSAVSAAANSLLAPTALRSSLSVVGGGGASRGGVVFEAGAIVINGDIDSRQRVVDLGQEFVRQARARGLVVVV